MKNLSASVKGQYRSLWIQSAQEGEGQGPEEKFQVQFIQKYNIRKTAINHSLVDFLNYHIFQK